MEILDPVGAANDGGSALGGLAPRLPSLDGARVGLVDNGWTALGTVFDGVRQLMRERHDAQVEVQVDSHERISDEVSGRLAELVDACVVGLGN